MDEALQETALLVTMPSLRAALLLNFCPQCLGAVPWLLFEFRHWPVSVTKCNRHYGISDSNPTQANAVYIALLLPKPCGQLELHALHVSKQTCNSRSPQPTSSCPDLEDMLAEMQYQQSIAGVGGQKSVHHQPPGPPALRGSLCLQSHLAPPPTTIISS